MLPRVEGKPYEADCDSSFVTKNAQGETETRTVTGVIARDSAGRRFQQQNILPTGADQQLMVGFDDESGSIKLSHYPSFASIYDPVGGAWHWIDREAGTTLMSIPVTLDQSGQNGCGAPTMEIQGMSVPVLLQRHPRLLATQPWTPGKNDIAETANCDVDSYTYFSNRVVNWFPTNILWGGRLRTVDGADTLCVSAGGVEVASQ